MTIDALSLAKLSGCSVNRLWKDAENDKLPITGFGDSFLQFQQRQFAHIDALMIEVARQIQDDDGLPAAASAKFVSNSIGRVRVDCLSDDEWIAMVRCRHTWGNTPHGSWPVTTFGRGEYWSTAYFAGSFVSLMAQICAYRNRLAENDHDADPARIISTSVSVADRRLRKRAAYLGIDLD